MLEEEGVEAGGEGLEEKAGKGLPLQRVVDNLRKGNVDTVEKKVRI